MIRKHIKSQVELEEFLKDFNTSRFSFDTETSDLKYDKLEVIGFSICDGTKAAYIQFKDHKTYKDTISFAEQCRCLASVFNLKNKGKGQLIIAHNIVFDVKALLKHSNASIYNSEWFDTMVAHHLLDENSPHGLKHLAKELLSKDDVVDYETANNASEEAFGSYAINDAIYTYELAQLFKKELVKEKLVMLFRKLEMPFLRVIVEMETNGILIDWEQLKITTKELEQQLFDLEIQMLELLGERYELQMTLDGNQTVKGNINFGSSKQLAEILFNRLNLQVIEETPSGAPSVGKKTIKSYTKTNEFVKTLYKHKIVSKLYSSFFSNYDKYKDGDDRVRPNFRDTGTRTGRLSCDNPNLQQLPKPNEMLPINTRTCFVVPKGYKMLTCDYAGQELRVLTELSQEPILIDAFSKGKDIHLATAKDFFDLPIPEEGLYEDHPEYETYKKKYKSDRDKAKTINFGIAYGKGAYGFSKDFGISEEEAEKILEKYFRSMPKVKEAIEKCHDNVTKNGYVETMWGRRRHFTKEPEGYYPRKAYREAFNFQIQGFSADMIRHAGIKLLNLKRRNPEWDLKIIATVHDEFVVELKEEFVDEASKQIKSAFESVTKFKIPIIADVEVGDNYGEAK